MEEPSVLDYLKSKLLPWKYPPIHLPAEQPSQEPIEAAAASQAEPTIEPIPAVLEIAAPEKPLASTKLVLPWRSLLALALMIAAQASMSPGPDRQWLPGVVLMILAAALLVWAIISTEWHIDHLPATIPAKTEPRLRLVTLVIGIALTLLAFISFGNLKFTVFNLTILAAALVCVSVAFWEVRGRPKLRLPTHIALSWANLFTVLVVLLVIFFRFYRLETTPPEMNSDHAEKILDVSRVLAGQTSIFFPNNGGREALQFYLVAALHRFFKIELGFTILKLATTLVGFLALPFIYLLGKEIGGRRLGLLAFMFAGVAYWPNVVSRAGMRLPFYILFTASTLYFLLRGLRTSQRNDFIYAGISLGLSAYGYSADRILPFLVAVGVGLFLLHKHSKGQRQNTLFACIALILAGLVLIMPLLRYILEEPNAFLFRTLTRMGSLERPLPGSAWLIFLENQQRALAMFSWSNGEIWPASVPGYPALSIVSGALFYLGMIVVLFRYLRQRHWLDLFLLISIPILMLPSTFSLAFPSENPSLYRTGGALVPVFLMVAIALDRFMDNLKAHLPERWGAWAAWVLALLLFAWSAQQDYKLVFEDYFLNYQRSSWNTSEMGQVVRDFSTTIGTPDTVWVMGYPHWVDTRLVAINAGYPDKDYALFIEQLELIRDDPRPKLFLINPLDQAAIDALQMVYPLGWMQAYHSKVETKDFLMYFTPPEVVLQPPPGASDSPQFTPPDELNDK